MAQGSVFKRGKNWSILYYDDTGKRRWKTVGATNKKDAERILRETMTSVDGGEYREIREIPFKSYATLWLDSIKSQVKPRTHEFYESTLRVHLLPHFGKYKLTHIRPDMIEQYLSKKLETNLSNKTIRHQLVTLKAMLNQGVKWGYLKSNPGQYVRGPRVEHEEMSFLPPHEIKLFLNETTPKFYPLFLTPVLTGARQAELLALKWSDITWPRADTPGQVHVRRSVYKAKFTETKSRTSNRTVVMSPKLASVLRKHQMASPPNKHDLIFANEEGNPIDPCNLVKREFYPSLRRAKLRQVRFHDLRHSYASMLLSQGENIKFIQHQLGHSSVQITLDRYSHLLPETHTKAAERLDATIFEDTSEGSGCNNFATAMSQKRQN